MAIFLVSFWTVFLITINEKLIETKQNLYSNKEQRMSVMLGTRYENKIKKLLKNLIYEPCNFLAEVFTIN